MDMDDGQPSQMDADDISNQAPIPPLPADAARERCPQHAEPAPPPHPPVYQQPSEQQEIIHDLEVDTRNSDNDSSLGSDVDSITTSLRSADYEFRFEHGRRYQSANGMYHLPNDVQEMDRLELQHLIWMEMLGGRYNLAPLESSRLTHALDVGCGTGNWAIEFANLHPDVQVLGTDLSPIQPDWVPANCSFFIDDCTHDWSFHQRFDYVHCRALTMGIADWDRLVDQAHAFLQPGGWLELQEFHLPLDSPDGSVAPGSALWTWGRKISEVCARLGIDSLAALRHGERLRRRGFQEVGERYLPTPLGPWAKGQRQKRIGWMGRKDLYEGIDGISKKLFLMMGEASEEVDDLLERCKAELLDSSIHVCMPLHVIWGQKPFTDTAQQTAGDADMMQ
ncbi:methyltransferase domain-containing protein [Xylariaceae sp. FL0016]|nr:methyltransferase domain-containing protein [Xylariaceae sp. FL0016]